MNKEGILSVLEAKHVLIAIATANCTDRLRSLDVRVNKLQENLFTGSSRSVVTSRSVNNYRGTRRMRCSPLIFE